MNCLMNFIVQARIAREFENHDSNMSITKPSVAFGNPQAIIIIDVYRLRVFLGL